MHLQFSLKKSFNRMFLVETELDYLPLFSLNWFEWKSYSSGKVAEILSSDNVLFMSPQPQKNSTKVNDEILKFLTPHKNQTSKVFNGHSHWGVF